ncbi:MAG TPA: hypothetical protein VLE89_02340, partial [Chlamydiales bacterium]|nr:hypothetical protein [Chlamydiales bacterium]
TDEVIEKEGIRRSHSAMQEADVILLLLDASRPLTPQDRHLLATAPAHKTVAIWNKIDLGAPPESIPSVQISAKELLGLDALKEAIETLIWKQGAPPKDEVLITKLRHYQALTNAIQSCQAVIAGLKSGISAEFVASDMRAALNELAAIIGTNVTEDILSAIFSQFCLGK